MNDTKPRHETAFLPQVNTLPALSKPATSSPSAKDSTVNGQSGQNHPCRTAAALTPGAS